MVATIVKNIGGRENGSVRTKGNAQMKFTIRKKLLLFFFNY